MLQTSLEIDFQETLSKVFGFDDDAINPVLSSFCECFDVDYDKCNPYEVMELVCRNQRKLEEIYEIFCDLSTEKYRSYEIEI